MECAICFDPLLESERLPLPCRCTVPYCLGCWDRALASSFNSAGHARCPSCRRPVRVDFDPGDEDGPARGRLIFSAETGDGSSAEDAVSKEGVVNRLAEQAAPLMTRLLRRFGERHSSLRAIAEAPSEALRGRSIRELKAWLKEVGGSDSGLLEKADLIDALIAKAGGGMIASRVVAATEGGGEGCPPLCVCGGALERLTGRARMRQLLIEQHGVRESANIDALLDHAADRMPSSVICDLCDTQLSPLQPVYTCANGDATILHPTTYDVCEVCFVRYAVEGLGDEALATERQLLYEEEEIEAQEEVEAQESGGRGEAARGALEG